MYGNTVTYTFQDLSTGKRDGNRQKSPRERKGIVQKISNTSFDSYS